MNLKNLVVVSLLLIPAPVWASRATDTRIESSSSDLFDSVAREKHGDSLDLYSDGTIRVGIDENGAGVRNTF